MGAVPWVRAGACNAVGALQWVHHDGCAAAVPWAHTATAAGPPSPPPPSPRGLRAAHPAGLSPEAAEEGEAAVIQPAEDPPQL